jgi:hypothetical protein
MSGLLSEVLSGDSNVVTTPYGCSDNPHMQGNFFCDLRG